MFNKQQSNNTPSPKGVETIIGPSVKVEGDFKGEGDLVIEGVLIGNIKTKNNLKIGSHAIIQANISANNAFISGKVKGNIHIKGKLELSSTALILGDIKTQVLSMESGALIKGNIDMPVNNISYQEDGPSVKTKATKENQEVE